MFSSKQLIIRSVFSFAMFLSFFLLPWWWVLLWGVGGTILFRYFFEIGLLGFAYDGLFNPFGIPWITTFTLCLLVVMVIIRNAKAFTEHGFFS